MKKSPAFTSYSLLLAVAFFTWGCPKKQAKIGLPPEGASIASAPASVPASAPDTQSGALGQEASAPPAQTTQNAQTTPAAPAAAAVPAPDKARVSGTIVSSRQGSASFKVSGHIAKLLVQTGDRVRKGQLLAQLDDTDSLLRNRIAATAVEQSRIAAEQAKRDLAREEQLRRENATTTSSFEKVSNSVASTAIALQQAQLNLQQLQNALEDTKLLASFDGIVARKLKAEGEHVAVGAAVLEIIGTANLEVSLRVPESLLKKARVGQTVAVSLPALGEQGTLKITRIVPVIQENSRTFEVIGQITSAVDRVLPGQFVEAEL